MEELIEVKLTRREISILVDVLGTTAFGRCDEITSKASDRVFDKLVDIAEENDIPYQGNNIGDEFSTDGERFIVDPAYTIRNV